MFCNILNIIYIILLVREMKIEREKKRKIILKEKIFNKKRLSLRNYLEFL